MLKGFEPLGAIDKRLLRFAVARESVTRGTLEVLRDVKVGQLETKRRKGESIDSYRRRLVVEAEKRAEKEILEATIITAQGRGELEVVTRKPVFVKPTYKTGIKALDFALEPLVGRKFFREPTFGREVTILEEALIPQKPPTTTRAVRELGVRVVERFGLLASELSFNLISAGSSLDSTIQSISKPPRALAGKKPAKTSLDLIGQQLSQDITKNSKSLESAFALNLKRLEKTTERPTGKRQIKQRAKITEKIRPKRVEVKEPKNQVRKEIETLRKSIARAFEPLRKPTRARERVRERARERIIERPRERVVERPIERVVERPIERPLERITERPPARIAERPRERLTERDRLREDFRRIEIPRIPSIPFIPFGGGDEGGKYFKGLKAPTRLAPSLTGLAFGIKGVPKGKLTGLEIRGLSEDVRKPLFELERPKQKGINFAKVGKRFKKLSKNLEEAFRYKGEAF